METMEIPLKTHEQSRQPVLPPSWLLAKDWGRHAVRLAGLAALLFLAIACSVALAFVVLNNMHGQLFEAIKNRDLKQVDAILWVAGVEYTLRGEHKDLFRAVIGSSARKPRRSGWGGSASLCGN